MYSQECNAKTWMSMASTECCIRNILYPKEWNYVCYILGYGVNFIRTDRQIWLILAGLAYESGLRVYSMAFIYRKYKYICLIPLPYIHSTIRIGKSVTYPSHPWFKDQHSKNKFQGPEL